MEKPVQREVQVNKTSPCPICGSNRLVPIFQFQDVPVLCNVIWNTRQEALDALRGSISLTFCPACGHVFNAGFDPGKLEYNLQYENSLHYSPHFQGYAKSLAQYLVEQYDLHGKSIIEIGSGKGDFLRLLCETGGSVGTGFDPSYAPTSADAHAAISFVRDLYSERYSDYPADFILSRHVLEHIDRPREFVQSLRRTIGEREHTAVFFEVPNLNYILRDTAIWDVIYEHYSYFSVSSLSFLFSRCGFNVLKTSEAYEGQFLSIEALPRNGQHLDPAEGSTSEAFVEQINSFSQRSQEKLVYWHDFIQQIRTSGKHCVIWGAGSKGISFLNMLQVTDEISHAVDINPRKLNKFITGTGQQIVAPDALKTIQPDSIIIMNPIYQHEIQNTIDHLGIRAELITAE